MRDVSFAVSARAALTGQTCSSQVEWPEYRPVEFVTDKIIAQDCTKTPGGYADPQEPPSAATLKKRGSHELQALGQPWRFDEETKRPLNPRGRTGLQNRGTLGKWGPNHAGDAIVTRYNTAEPGALSTGSQPAPLAMLPPSSHDDGSRC